MTDPATQCDGTWGPVPVPDESGDLHVLSCSGCGDWWVHIGQHATVVNNNTAATVEDAVRIAVAAKATQR